jgi:hypothetical protein
MRAEPTGASIEYDPKAVRNLTILIDGLEQVITSEVPPFQSRHRYLRLVG